MTANQEFRLLRKRLDLTGEALAKAHGIDARTVRRWEQDENTDGWRKVPEPILRIMRLWLDPRLPKKLRPKT
jgi:transcriptional regulator with XRE-family HTH domain